MLKILVVDDSIKRVALIKDFFKKNHLFKYLNIIYCDTADKGRSSLLAPFDLLILDVVLPKKVNGTPHAINSYDLLKDISNPKRSYIRPGMIIGMTADVSELGKYREFFLDNASIVLDGSLSNLDWMHTILSQVSVLLRSKQASVKLYSDKLLISIHGIRTYGQWQIKLNEEIKKYSREYDFIEMKYGYFDILSFCIPYFRQKKYKKISSRLRSIISKNKDKEITIIAHSFGTFIVSYALSSMCLDNKIKNTILCASPLPTDFDISHIIDSSEMTVNECGVNDVVLLAANVAVLGLGDAGRKGFDLDNSSKFINRYHKGGHSLYFLNSLDSVSFVEKNWLPIILSNTYPTRIDVRRNYLGEDVTHLIVKILSYCKPIIYILIIVMIIYFVFPFN